jgi:uncharacterized protein (TIGR02680 family)
MTEPFEAEAAGLPSLLLDPGGVGARSLPVARRERFQPLRAGILNLWQYDEQELHFHQGRLILRGENGSGKSKALEVLLPFLLDADLSPHRLDPFGGSARTMEWNLLQDGRYESRVGYVWLELGRLEAEAPGETPRPVYWTLGCGLRASQRTRRVDSWYFLTRRRIGADLEIVSPGRTPLLKEQLRQAIGDDGWVFETGRDYRERLDAQIFGLGEDRFSTLRQLLLQLRRPHLSEKLDPNTLSDLLRESLPPLDADLIGQLSEGFERLDNDQKELVRAQAASASVEQFLDLYREYARGMARGRAAEVRQSDSRYHKVAGEVRDAETESAELEQALERLAAAERLARDAIDTLGGVLRALERDPAMRSAQELRAKREQAEDLARRRERDERDVERETVALERAGLQLTEVEGRARGALEDRERSAAESAVAAREAELEPLYVAACEALPSQVSSAKAVVRAGLRKRHDDLAEIEERSRERERSREAERRAAELLAEAEAQVRAALERRLAAQRGVEAHRDELEAALLAWWQELAELRLDDAGFERLQARVAAIASGEAEELASEVAALAREQHSALVAERTRCEREIERAAEEWRATDEERQRIADARELGPEPARTRPADRGARAGAPLYLLCDFSAGLSAGEQAGLEAALEAAGLLDAWILPEGGVVSSETLDAFLIPAPGEGPGGRLADVLVPVPGYGVDLEVLDAVLSSIGLPSATGGDAAEVAGDGTYRLGPLRGAWAKPVAEHIGAGARAATRERRLAELAARLAALETELAELAARRDATDARLDRLARETGAVPSPAELRRAHLLVEAARADEARRRGEGEAARERWEGARQALEAAQQRLLGRARELGLAGYLDDLPGYRDRLARFELRFTELAAAATTAAQAESAATTGRELFAEAGKREAEARHQALASAALARGAWAEHRELEATVGIAAREIVERFEAAKRRLEEVEAERESGALEMQSGRERRARLLERLESRQRELGERDAERTRAVEQLHGFAAAGFLALTVPEGATEVLASWSLTRALDLAREIERTSAAVDMSMEAANRRANRLHERYRILSADLGADFQPSLLQDDDLWIVRVAYNGRDHDPAGLLAALRENIDVRRTLLADHERDLLRRFLLGEVGAHLRQRLLLAQEHVGFMNEALADCRTASGMTLKLTWEPLAEVAQEVREAVQLLRKDLDLLAESDRRRLETFFQNRIAEARERWETVPWREHLMAALDYRAWYRFRILRRSTDDRDWTELTRRGHEASSGGEKAVALHLPLFAAAAAHYRSAYPSAPRLILLDEAFAGIDQGMRGRCMGLLVAFDLDFMMTSHDEWGCYEELPGVATYQLARDPNLEGVSALRFLWNGKRLRDESSGPSDEGE